ncbi:MAG: metallophosphoesterase [Planctomycetaceae bacterium]|nr:metallophosphoesterase [Planctomycetaceae bacterium]
MLPLYSVAAENNSWSFGIIADTQWKDMEAPFYGTSIHVIDAINAEMIRHKVDLVIQVGDLVDKPSAAGFQMRAAHNKALGKAGIRFYPVRGNHDSKGEAEVAQFKLAFPGLPGTPEGGGSSPDLPGAAGLTYSFTHKGGKFICLDTFPIIAREGKNGKAYTVSDYLPWIEAELKKNDHRFAFVFAHKNLLGQSHKDNLFSSDKENQDSNPEMQNSFFACLQRYGVKYFFSGHDHIYNRSKIKSPDGKSEITQLICGSAAHKFYSPKEPFLERETPIFQEVKHVGFIIARVKDNQVNFEYYSTKPFGEEPKKPKWKLTDSFSFTTN